MQSSRRLYYSLIGSSSLADAAAFAAFLFTTQRLTPHPPNTSTKIPTTAAPRYPAAFTVSNERIGRGTKDSQLSLTPIQNLYQRPAVQGVSLVN